MLSADNIAGREPTSLLNRQAGQGSVIIEIAGPSAVGKTTLAHALVVELAASLNDARLSASARPAERTPSRAHPGRLAAAYMRASTLLDLLLRLGQGSGGAGARLLALLPPDSPLWLLRMRRYLDELDRRWAEATESDEIVVFDQAYHSALAALAALRRRRDEDPLAHAFEIIPKPDLLIRLRPSPGLLETRLAARLQAQGRLERLFELDTTTTLKQVEEFRRLDKLINGAGIRVIDADFSVPAQIACTSAHVVEHVAALRRERGR